MQLIKENNHLTRPFCEDPLSHLIKLCDRESKRVQSECVNYNTE